MTSVLAPAVRWHAPGRASASQSVRPGPIAAGHVRVGVTSAGLCGTDLAVWAGRAGRGVPGIVLGHEFGGRVLETGDQVVGIRVGDLVAVDPNIGCGTCRQCRAGRRARCAERRLLGVDLDGGFQATIDVGAGQIIPVPTDDPRVLGLVEPIAVGAHAVERAGVAAGDRVGVIGGGPIGMACVVEARARGAACAVLETDPVRRDSIAASGVTAAGRVDDWADGEPFDVVVDSVGRAGTVAAALAAVADGGTVCIVGLSHDDHLPPPEQIVRRELTVTGSFCYDTADLHHAAALVGAYGLEILPIEPVYGLESVPALLEQLSAGRIGRGKALVLPEHDPSTP